GEPPLPLVEHGRRAVLLLRDEERAVLRPRQRPGRSKTARLARGRLETLRGRLENLLLPPSPVLQRRYTRRVRGHSSHPRAAVRHLWRQRRLFGPRSHLRTRDTTKRHLL